MNVLRNRIEHSDVLLSWETLDYELQVLNAGDIVRQVPWQEFPYLVNTQHCLSVGVEETMFQDGQVCQIFTFFDSDWSWAVHNVIHDSEVIVFFALLIFFKLILTLRSLHSLELIVDLLKDLPLLAK